MKGSVCVKVRAALVSIGELALVELGPFLSRAGVWFHSDGDFGLTTSLESGYVFHPDVDFRLENLPKRVTHELLVIDLIVVEAGELRQCLAALLCLGIPGVVGEGGWGVEGWGLGWKGGLTGSWYW